MRNIILITLTLLVFIGKSTAQDCIFFENGKVVTGKITAVGAGKITFTQTDSIGTITHTVYSNRVHYIKYSNGKTDTIPGNENYTNHHFLQFYHKNCHNNSL